MAQAMITEPWEGTFGVTDTCVEPTKKTVAAKKPKQKKQKEPTVSTPVFIADRIEKFNYNGVCLDYILDHNWTEADLFNDLREAHQTGYLRSSDHLLANVKTGCMYILNSNMKKFDQMKVAYNIATKQDMGLREHFGDDEIWKMMQDVASAIENDSVKPLSYSNKRLVKQSNNKSANTKRQRKDVKPTTQG